MTQPIECIHPKTPNDLLPYRKGLQDLLTENLPYLQDDHDSPDVATLLANLESTLPDVMLAVQHDTVLVGGSLTDIAPGQETTIHGVSWPHARKTGAIELVTFALMERAFVDYGIKILKARVAKHHHGARGFCLNYRFKPVQTIERGMCQQGQWHAVTEYQLSSKTYYQQTRRTLAHVLWKKEEEWQQCPQDHPHHQNRIQLATGRCV